MSSPVIKPKVLFVMPNLGAGGAERVMSFIASHLDKEKFKCTLAIIGSEIDNAYDVKGIEIIYLNKKQVRAGFFRIIKIINSGDFNVVISSLGHVNAMMAITSIFLKKVKFIGRETIVRSASYNGTIDKGGIFTALQKQFLELIICQSNDMYVDLIDNYGYKKSKLIVINNPITQLFPLKKIKPKGTTRFITVGRLAEHKGHERILKGLATLDYPFHYDIVGSGEYEAKIVKIVNELGLQNKVQFIPFTKDVAKFLSESDCFLSGSFVEGFPNALIESCSVGTPVIAFDAPGGINEIIIEDVNGYIVQNEKSFKRRLNDVVNKQWEPKEVRKSVISRYSEEIILKNYEDMIYTVLDY